MHVHVTGLSSILGNFGILPSMHIVEMCVNYMCTCTCTCSLHYCQRVHSSSRGSNDEGFPLPLTMTSRLKRWHSRKEKYSCKHWEQRLQLTVLLDYITLRTLYTLCRTYMHVHVHVYTFECLILQVHVYIIHIIVYT